MSKTNSGGITRQRSGNFVTCFESQANDIVCPSFYVLHHAYNCVYSCSYCFLQATMRMRPPGAVYYDNYPKMVRAVKRWMKETKSPALLNAGELSDSLAIDTKYLDYIVPIFAGQNKHILLILTKDLAYKKLKFFTPNPQVVVSATINPERISQRCEPDAPLARDRIMSLLHCAKAGWRVRLRIDPFIPVPEWENHYRYHLELLQSTGLLEKLERITLGSLRSQGNLASLAAKKNAQQANPFADFKHVMQRDGTDGRLRLNFDLRRDFYSFVYGFGYRFKPYSIDRVIPLYKLGLCKETQSMWNLLNWPRGGCNCMG